MKEPRLVYRRQLIVHFGNLSKTSTKDVKYKSHVYKQGASVKYIENVTLLLSLRLYKLYIVDLRTSATLAKTPNFSAGLFMPLYMRERHVFNIATDVSVRCIEVRKLQFRRCSLVVAPGLN